MFVSAFMPVSVYVCMFLCLCVCVCMFLCFFPAKNRIPVRGDPHVLVVGDPGLGKSQVSDVVMQWRVHLVSLVVLFGV